MDIIRFRLRVLAAVLVAIVILSSLGFMAAEGLSIADAFYFSIVTIATVGYGDIHPVTPLGKALGLALIILGVGTFLGVIANVTELLLSKRDIQTRLKNRNILIGMFFSEAGTPLLKYFASCDPQAADIRKRLDVSEAWTAAEFSSARTHLARYTYHVDIDTVDLEHLRSLFTGWDSLLLRIMENPNLSEHESFTDMLMAVFHLREELLARPDLRSLPQSDRRHLAGDASRAYSLLVHHWLDYMGHLQKNYPYLFSLAMRTNPFNPDASAVVA